MSSARAWLTDASPLVRRTVIVLLAAGLAAMFWGGWLWLRDMSVFRVREVSVQGVHGREGAAIERALRQTGRRMSTLHVREQELRQAVRSFASVRTVSADADFPRKLTVTVDAYDPVAVLVTGADRRIAVAGNGTLLRGAGPGTRLPRVSVKNVPTEGALTERAPRLMVRALGVAPTALRRQLEKAWWSSRGLKVSTRKGPLLELGDASRMSAKWAAVARVLADPASGGARVIDVRLPRRPAARGFGPDEEVGEAAASGAATEAPGQEEAATAAAPAAATPAPDVATGTTSDPQP